MHEEEIKDRDSLHAWLMGRSADESSVIATRAALRAVPFLLGAAWGGNAPVHPRGRLHFILRALFVAWVYSRYPTASSAYSFRLAIKDAVLAVDSKLQSTHTVAPDLSGVYAADAANSAINVLGIAASKYNSYLQENSSAAIFHDTAAFSELGAGASAAIIATAAVASAARASASLGELYQDLSDLKLVWPEVSREAFALETDVPVTVLSSGNLWYSGVPEAIEAQWRSLKKNMLQNPEEHWDVWTDWYEARLRGEPGNEAEEIARIVEVTEEEWQAGPAVANKKIKDILARFRDPAPEPVREPDPDPAPEQIPTPPPRLTTGPRLRATADGRLDLEPVSPPAVPIAERRAAVAEVAQELLDQCGGNDSQHFVVPLQRLIEALTAKDTSFSRLHLRLSSLVGLAALDRQRRERFPADRFAEVDPALGDVPRAALDTLLRGINGLYVHDQELRAERDSLIDPDSVAAAQKAASTNAALLQDLVETPDALTDAARNEIKEVADAATPDLPGIAPSSAASVEAALAVQTAATEAASSALVQIEAARAAEEQRRERKKEEQRDRELDLQAMDRDPIHQSRITFGKVVAGGAGTAAIGGVGYVGGWLVANGPQILTSLAADPRAAAAYEFVAAVLRILGVAL